MRDETWNEDLHVRLKLAAAANSLAPQSEETGLTPDGSNSGGNFPGVASSMPASGLFSRKEVRTGAR